MELNSVEEVWNMRVTFFKVLIKSGEENQVKVSSEYEKELN